MGWKVHELKRSYEDVVYAVDDILTNEIQALQLQLKTCNDYNEDYNEKQTSSVHILSQYLGQPMKFSAKPSKLATFHNPTIFR